MNSIIKHHSLYLLPAAALLLTHPGLAQQPSTPDETIREIRLIQDDAQTPIVSKIYELKHVKATDIRPFVLNAVTRFDSQSRVERVNYISAKRQLLIVSTAAELIPYIDDLIEKFDRPGKPDASGSIIAGTGITRLSYTPKHRAAQDIVDIINGALRTGTGIAYLNQDTNTIYWKDDVTSAKAILAWVKRLDRPRPQVTLRLNYYELRDSDLKDVGLDYLSWRNGPGLNLFAAGYSAGHLASTEAALAGTGILADLARDISQGWSRGGYFAAPQFDLSFVRLLRQSGKAKLVSSASLTLVNTPLYGTSSDVTKTYSAVLGGEQAAITKNQNGQSDVTASNATELSLKVINPVICFGYQASDVDASGNLPDTPDFYNSNNGGIVFGYSLGASSVVERTNLGAELGHITRIDGNLTLGFRREKLLGSYSKEVDATQTTGLPWLTRLPVLKYLFGTETTQKEKVTIIVTAEAIPVHPNQQPTIASR